MSSTRHMPGCPGPEKPLFEVQDLNRRVDTIGFQYLRCQSCGVIRLANVPNDLQKYYPDAYYDIPSIERLAALAGKDSFKIDTLGRHAPPGRLLDIGPAWGTFALQAKHAGYQVDAIEMDARCCDYLNRTLGIRAVCSAMPHEAIAGLGPHDAITLWHVIEHLPDPWAVLQAAAANLTPGGILIVATPNPNAWQFRIMGAKWPHIDAPRHLYLFPSETLIRCAGQFGLEVAAVRTGDSDGKSWNRFGWQRLLMNYVSGKWLTRAAFLAGYGISMLFAPIENREPNGSAYTLILRKRNQA